MAKKEGAVVEAEEGLSPEEETPKTPEGETPEGETPETPEGEPPEGEPPEGEELTADELKAQLEASQAEVAKLKGEKPAEDEIPEEPMEAAGKERGTAQDIPSYLDKVYPVAKKLYRENLEKSISVSVTDDGKAKVNIDPKALDSQFDVTMEAVDKYLCAFLNDHVYPHVRNLGRMNINLQNEVKILNLREENPKFKGLEKQVRKVLSGMDISERGKKTSVQDAFLKLLGGASVKEAIPEPEKKPAQLANRKMLRDIAATAGAGKGKKPMIVNLTADQEEDRLKIEQNEGPFPKELYSAKLKAVQDKAKAAGKKIPLILR